MSMVTIRRRINKNRNITTTFNNTNITAAIYNMYNCTYNYDKDYVRLDFKQGFLNTRALRRSDRFQQDELVTKTTAILKAAQVLYDRRSQNEFNIEVEV